MTERERHELWQELQRMFSDLRLNNSRLSKKLERKREEFIKVYQVEMNEMLRSKARAYAYLDDENPHLQQLAIFVLSERWAPDSIFYGHCERLAGANGDLGVRRGALRQLARRYSLTRNVRLLSFMAELIRKNMDNGTLVKYLYETFCSIAGNSLDTTQFASGRVFDSIDWELIRQYEC